MKKKLFLISVATLALGGCASNNNPQDEPQDVLPTSISVSPNILDLKASESKDLNDLLTFAFEPENTTNKNVVFAAESPYFAISNSTITTFEYSGTGTLQVSSAANSNVFTDVTINVTKDEPVEVKYKVTYNSSVSFSIGGLKEDGYLENEEVSFNVQIHDSEKEIDNVIADETTLKPVNGLYSFAMPGHDVSIIVALKNKEVIPPEPAAYAVSYLESEDYVVLGLKEKYQKDEEVKFAIDIANDQKQLDSVKAGVAALTEENGFYSFHMPEHDVFLEISLKDKEAMPPQASSSQYDVVFDMGTRKTSYAFKEGEENAIKDCFKARSDSSNMISSVLSFSYVYGGGYGGRGGSAWLTGDILKMGTTSVNGSLTLELTKPINKVEITGMASAATAKVEINGIEVACSDMAVAEKETVDNNSYTSLEVEVEDSTSLTIATTNKKVLYIKSMKLFYGEDQPVVAEKYTVTWKNDDGTVLKTDADVLAGTIPEYHGDAPSKPSDDTYDYVFSGWNPKPAPIKEDSIYTATFTAMDKDAKIAGSAPMISTDGKTVEYGVYPQTRVHDESLISTLNSLPLDSNNYVLYQNEYYAKAISNVYNNESYAFDDGASIANSSEYWFRCETIKWKVIQSESKKYTLISDRLLDAHNFYINYLNRIVEGKTVYPNDYKESSVRAYLNGEFLNQAFFLSNDAIVNASIDSFSDKVYLPSVNEINALDVKMAKTTDYSRSIGAFASKDKAYKFNGSYWTRTPSNDFAYCAWNVNAGGVLSEYAVDGSSHSIRPCIQISF